MMFRSELAAIAFVLLAAMISGCSSNSQPMALEGAEDNLMNDRNDGGKPAEPRKLTDEQWRERLTPEQYAILRRSGTEAPGSGEYDRFFEPGEYLCAGCGNELFTSGAKFDSGCGWPAFDRPVDAQAVEEKVDGSHGMVRTEVRCSRCGGHLGHVFNDGPRQTTGQRYCINSAAMEFRKGQDDADKSAPRDEEQQAKDSGRTQVATFGAGCFWGVEETFRKLDGVVDTAVGYSGGATENPTYEQVCTDRTGHAEVVRVEFDPARISYERLLEVFWANHDPTQRNRQGPDVGRQYRSVIFFHDAAQKKSAETSRAALEASRRHGRPIATEIVPAQTFYKAEEYHQQYLRKRGQDACHN